MATVEYFNEDVYRAAASELTLRKSQSFKPQELSNTVSYDAILWISEIVMSNNNQMIIRRYGL